MIKLFAGFCGWLAFTAALVWLWSLWRPPPYEAKTFVILGQACILHNNNISIGPRKHNLCPNDYVIQGNSWAPHSRLMELVDGQDVTCTISNPISYPMAGICILRQGGRSIDEIIKDN